MPTDPDRFALIHKAAGLPKGDPTRRKILAKLAGNWDYVWATAKPKLTKAEDALTDTARYLESQGMSGEVNDLVGDALSMVGKALRGMKRTASKCPGTATAKHDSRRERLARLAGMSAQYAPDRIFPFMAKMKLKLSFDQLAAREKGYKLTDQIPDKQIFKNIKDLTEIRLPTNVKIPMQKSLEAYLLWLAKWAVKHGQMDWDEPYAWAVPAGVQLGFMAD